MTGLVRLHLLPQHILRLFLKKTYLQTMLAGRRLLSERCGIRPSIGRGLLT